ncbi:Retinal homeobox protein Rx2 [Holothuria leucospilota]|uniref:Retinal homeobox protein Rx2 n=1 Tax=Holothuria leucospilota TaxID=206669 RepID=A0A9Q1HI36_HOLLE|nr:Retinal homeobox protein Rx2 [Holothuria leucospilota]
MRMETPIRTTNDTDEFKLSPKRRRRTTISTEQLQKLEALYDRGQWPSRAAKEALATEINKSINFVNVWFQNKRSRVRKALLEESEHAAVKERLTSPAKVIRKYRDIPIAPKLPYLSRSLNTGCALPPLREDLYRVLDSSNQCRRRNLVQASFSEDLTKYRSLCRASPISIDNQLGLHYDETTDRQPAWFECVNEEKQRLHHSHLLADFDYITWVSQGRNDVLTRNSHQYPCYPSTSKSPHPPGFQKKTNLSTNDDREVHRQEAGCLLQILLYMMMIVGGHWKLIQDKRDAQLAIDACLYGLKLRDGKTLIIDKDYGFGIKDDEAEDIAITQNRVNTPQ